MSILASVFRCLCLCIVLEKGTWYPNSKSLNKNKNRAILRKSSEVKSKKNERNLNKPEWLKEWTISKGWVHNKSHLLDLGRNNSSENLVIVEETHAIMEKKTYQEVSDDSSVSLSNVEDLISMTSNLDRNEDSRNTQKDFNKIETMSNSEDDSSIHDETLRITERKEQQNMSLLYNKISENYRKNFPENFNKYQSSDLSLPEIYKERLLINKNKESNVFLEIWKYIKPKRRKKKSYNCKFTVNELYDKNENSHFTKTVDNKLETLKTKRTNLGKNIALYNTLNSKTNLHEDTIYECSEENSNNNSLNYVYFNPIYSSSTAPAKKYYDFHSNHSHVCNNFGFDRRLVKSHQNGFLRNSDKNSLKTKLRTEKYVIRHIRVRVMLSMRLGKVQKVHKKPEHNVNRRQLHSVNNGEKDVADVDKEMQMRIARMHEEQKRIGNGKTSIKIQNMR
ncbi:homeobox protein 3-like [Anoplophora glabripennis]|uniref:homeobox protein 3-like n=1 Tax=Anoplophora glabripennis TaxID=217634 RepID=UPI0008740469|nr:homeobox protein 3-like [Anoplophora glabripennis]